MGPRDNEVEGNAFDWLLGAVGRAGPFDLDFGARMSINKAINLGRNYVVNPIALQYLIDGTYNAADPRSLDGFSLGPPSRPWHSAAAPQ